MNGVQLDDSTSIPSAADGEVVYPTLADLPPVPKNHFGSSESSEYATFDEGTPDDWVKRDKRLVKLTGKHPHNVESPLSLLFHQGFLTPQNLFFVRSHGAVPDVVKSFSITDSWSLNVCGMVRYPTTFTIAELKAHFEVVTIPITLVCAGNRRREQNVVQKGLGFNWGAGGISTALWTGVYLADILEHVQPCPQTLLDDQSAATILRPKHVIFEGADDTLPQGPYGTSQPLKWARDREKGILVCWAMNGEPLEPDHGFPLRVVVPGRIGGRSVKWLRKVEISHQESQHYLHFFDNKLLPTQVTPAQASKEDHWWRDTRYIIQDLNVNSAIARPAHDEVLSDICDPTVQEDDEQYHIRGYAYSGGGRRVTRVEISLDEGETWLLADIEYPEDIYRQPSSTFLGHYGKFVLTQRASDECFCWCFWTFRARILDLRKSHSIQARAMDESLALQSRDMYWSCMGMMNNWYFRIAIHKLPDGSLLFEHPTMPGTQPGGWMQRIKNSGQDILRPDFQLEKKSSNDTAACSPAKNEQGPKMVNDDVAASIGEEELNATDQARFVVNGQVFDASEYLDDHPGGASAITSVRGQDVTEDFLAIHSPGTVEKLSHYHVAKFIQTVPSEKVVAKEAATNSLSTTSWMKVKLASIQKISPDTRIYRFTLPSEDQLLPLMPGQHIYVRLPSFEYTSSFTEGQIHGITTNDKATRNSVQSECSMHTPFVQRAYTPISPINAVGYMDLLVKIYLPCEGFPYGGKMSACFNALKIGDLVEIKGPLGSFIMLNGNNCRWKDVQWAVREVGMICGGSGITPILQILRVILEDDQSNVRVRMIDANKREEDILCRKELEGLQSAHSERFKLQYTLTSPSASWIHSAGHANDLIQEFLPFSGEQKESLVLMCGPDGMVKTCKLELMKLGWNASQLVVF